MQKVENYININSKDIDAYSQDKLFTFQGQNILLKKDVYSKDKLKQFFDSVFNYVNKIVTEGDDIHYLISIKFEEEVIEPFDKLESKSGELHNDTSLMTDFVCSLNKKHKYEI